MIIDKPNRWVFLFIFLMVMIVLVIGITRGKRPKKIETMETVSIGDLTQRIEDLHLIHFRREDVDWELAAQNAIIRNGEKDASIQEIDITYVTKGGTRVRLLAAKGGYSISKNIFFVEEDGGVDIKVGQGITIKSDNLIWSGDKKEIHSQGKIQVIGEKFILEGEDLVANVDDGVYEINKNIKATVWP